MIDKSKLKELALAAKSNDFARGTSLTPEFLAFTDEATPAAILELLAELEAAGASALEEAAKIVLSKAGEQISFAEMAAAIRALATTASTEQHQGANSAALLEAAAQACEVERVEDTGTDGDLGYNRAVRDCAAAVRALATAASIEPASRGAAQGRNTCDKDGGTCGIGGYCKECHHNLSTPAQAGQAPTLDALDTAFSEEIKRVSDLDYPANSMCRTFYANLRTRLAASPAPSAKQEPSAPVASEKEALRRLAVQSMADCMDMVRQDLIDMGIIDKTVAPMFIPEAVAAYIKSLAAPAAPVAQQQPSGNRCHDCGHLFDLPDDDEPSIGPTYYVRHPDDTYTVADPQPSALPVAGSQQVPEEVGGVNLARLLRNLEETSYNEGSMDLACRCSDSLTVIKGLLAAAPSVPGAQQQTSMQAAADYIDAKAQHYLRDHAETDPDTGATVFNYGEAGRDYHSTLTELADEIRALSATPPDKGSEDDKRDADRYRWLRFADLDALAAANWKDGEVYTGEAFDAAIDAARAVPPAQGESQS